MEIQKYSRSVKPSQQEMKDISTFLLDELSRFFGQEVHCFRRDIVEGESLVCGVHGIIGGPTAFEMSWEGVVLFDVNNTGPPSVNAELFLFSMGKRVGLQAQHGRSYLILEFSFESTLPTWKIEGWVHDGPDDWERIVEPRTELYSHFQDTWEDNE